jgi:predicted transposase YdaD
MRYLMKVAGPNDPQPFLEALDREVGQEITEQAMGLLDAMLEKGRAEGEIKGKAEGKAEGLLEGRRGILEKLLQLKFGPLSDQARERVAQLDLEALDAAGERVLSATRIEEVLG